MYVSKYVICKYVSKYVCMYVCMYVHVCNYVCILCMNECIRMNVLGWHRETKFATINVATLFSILFCSIIIITQKLLSSGNVWGLLNVLWIMSYV